jgi:hypothetical protein
MSDDDSTLAEKMNRGLYLDPGFKSTDKPGLVNAIRDDIDDTTIRAQANVDQKRQNEHDIELIAKDMEREAKRKAAEAAEAAAKAAESTDEK